MCVWRVIVFLLHLLLEIRQYCVVWVRKKPFKTIASISRIAITHDAFFWNFTVCRFHSVNDSKKPISHLQTVYSIYVCIKPYPILHAWCDDAFGGRDGPTTVVVPTLAGCWSPVMDDIIFLRHVTFNCFIPKHTHTNSSYLCPLVCPFKRSTIPVFTHLQNDPFSLHFTPLQCMLMQVV